MGAKSKAVKKTVVTLCVLAALRVTCCGALYGVMRQTPEQFGRVMAEIPNRFHF